MTDALSAMEYSHWMMVAGACLVVLGLIGLIHWVKLLVVSQFEFGNLIWTQFFFSALLRNCALILFLLRVFTILTRVRASVSVGKLIAV
jgi:predicted ferric reductase